MDLLGEFVTLFGAASMALVVAVGIRFSIRTEDDNDSTGYAGIATVAFAAMMLILMIGLIQKIFA
ncbi:MAG: hypothetical protein EOP83_08100 [Verrucomicrobiaceae bacterium]|nr:MAG: hypothetical protein EOP83_08100 [Verrucomicrobiaceae bacterium]